MEKARIPKSLRFEVLKRDGFKCRYCGISHTKKELHVDHIIPESRGGATCQHNLLTACIDCNLGKGSVPLTVHKLKRFKYAEIIRQHKKQDDYINPSNYDIIKNVIHLSELSSIVDNYKYASWKNCPIDSSDLDLFIYFKEFLSLYEIQECIHDISNKLQTQDKYLRLRAIIGECHLRTQAKLGWI
jgi:hypothetical protein